MPVQLQSWMQPVSEEDAGQRLANAAAGSKAALDNLQRNKLRAAFNRSLYAGGESLGTDATGNPITAAPGDINQAGFIQQQKSLDLDPEAASAAVNYNLEQRQKALQGIGTNLGIRSLGGDVRAGGRVGATIGAPISTVERVEPQKLTSEKLSSWFTPTDKSMGTSQETPAPTQSAPSSYAPDDANTIRITGSTPQTSPTMQLPQDSEMGTAEYKTTTPPDQRSYTQRIEDSAAGGIPGGSIVGTTKPSTDNPLFKWEPQATDSNQFRQYNTALQAKLASSGYSSPSDYLQSVYEANAVDKDMVQPNVLLNSQGPEGIAKYQEQQNAYQAAVARADQAGKKAVIEARNALAEDAKQYGVNTVEQNKSDIAPGLILRDPAKRNEAAALITNTDNIGHVQKALAEAGTDTTKLGLVKYQLARVYATAMNPGQQLSEGNLVEVGKALYPEYADSKQFMLKTALALGRGLRSNDWSGFDQISDVIDGSDPKVLASRMNRLASDAANLNKKTLGSYVIGKPVEEPKEATTVQEPTQVPTGVTNTPKALTQADLDAWWKSKQKPSGNVSKAVVKPKPNQAKKLPLAGWDLR